MITAEITSEDGDTIRVRLSGDSREPSPELAIGNLRQQLAAVQAANAELEQRISALNEQVRESGRDR